MVEIREIIPYLVYHLQCNNRRAGWWWCNPKEFLQIARFRNALHCLHAGSQIRLNQLAYDWGYCDKSHLIKDFKTFMGYTPKEYLSLFNSVFINGERETKSNRL